MISEGSKSENHEESTANLVPLSFQGCSTGNLTINVSSSKLDDS